MGLSTLKDRLRHRLKAEKLTATGACQKAGISRNFLTQIFNGQIKNPRLDKIEKIAPVLGATYEWLVFGNEARNSQECKGDSLDTISLLNLISFSETAECKDIVKRLFSVIKARGLTEGSFLNLINISTNEWNKILSGDINLDLKFVLRSSVLLHVSAEWLYTGNNYYLNKELADKIY